MSDRGRFRPGDERLGRVLREAVETRGRAPSASPAGAVAGSRAFVAALERGPERPRPSGERPRFGLIVLMAVLVAVVTTALALWPALTSHRPAAPQPSPAAAHREAGAR